MVHSFAYISHGRILCPGNLEDEGTVSAGVHGWLKDTNVSWQQLFSFTTLDVLTDDAFKEWFRDTYIPIASDDEIDQLAEMYPEDVLEGSPYGTGILNVLTPQVRHGLESHHASH